MSIEIKTPDFPESIEEGTLMTWVRKDGENVSRDEKIADVETDKVVLEVFAVEAGVLHVQKQEGDVLERGDVLGQIDPDGAGAPASMEDTAGEDESEKASPAEDTETEDSAASNASAPSKEPAPEEPSPKPAPEKSGAPAAATDSSTPVSRQSMKGLSPSVRQLIQEKGLNPEDIHGTGKNGRITKVDVENFLKETPPSRQAVGLVASEHRAPEKPASAKAEPAAPTGPQRRVPMTRIRARIAERLLEVQQTAALLTTFNEVNMGPVMTLRKKYKEKFEKEYGTKLGLMSFFVKASVEALKKFPVINASLDGSDIVYNELQHIGIAVDSPRGLVVPVVREADRLSFADIERTIRDFGARAQESKLQYEELVGGTFTITNGGVFGSMLSTPIINAPQSAILGMHSIQDRPVALDGEVVIRPVMYVALTYDHRIVDGRDAVQFLVSIKESLEDPSQLLLQL